MASVSAKVERILLPLDVSQDSLTALQVAFDLAAALGSEVSGLFIEDSRLLIAGSFPFAHEVGSSSGTRRPIQKSDIEHRFRTVASKARDALSEAGQRRNVQFSFRVARGDVPAEILTAATEADIVVLGKAGWSLGALRKPGRTCLAILSSSRIPVMIVERGATFAPPILVVNDGTVAGRRAVDFAQELGRSLGWEIAVFSAHGMYKADDVLRSIDKAKSRLMILPASLPLTECASKLRCAVLFVP